jgi:hypothetical protein
MTEIDVKRPLRIGKEVVRYRRLGLATMRSLAIQTQTCSFAVLRPIRPVPEAKPEEKKSEANPKGECGPPRSVGLSEVIVDPQRLGIQRARPKP